MKHLTIRHFGPIEEIDIELKRVNLIIGPQSAGKSTVLKVACFCSWMERQIELTQNKDPYCEPSYLLKNLVGFHKLDGYIHNDTFIRYSSDFMSFDYSEKTKECSFEWNDPNRWKYKRPKISYIPSERNLVAAIPNWFQVSMNNDNILDFMQEWEFARKAFSKGEKILDLDAKYKYNPANKSDKIKLPNGKDMDLTMASSGLQSLTPLYIMLKYLTKDYYKQSHSNVKERTLRNDLTEIVAKECGKLPYEKQQKIVDDILTPHHSELFIEEPEAHIFPSTQKSFVYSLVKMLKHNHHCFIATHSPYILTSFNNTILAGEAIAAADDKAKEVEKILPKNQSLRYKEIAAFEISNGRIKNILDDEFQLISAEAIDSASQEISNDFDKILNI